MLSLETGEWRQLMRGGAGARYLPTGYVVFSQTGSLRLAPLDLVQGELTGSTIPILDGVRWGNLGGLELADFTVSQSGTLLYVPGDIQARRTTPVWVDRDGQASSLGVEPAQHLQPRLSPDGGLVALVRSQGLTGDIWILDVGRGTATRLTVGGTNYTPLWTPDGKKVTFQSNGDIFWKPADGSVEAQALLIREYNQRPWSWSPDGRILAFTERTPAGLDIWVMPLEGAPSPFLATSFNETMPIFSPDGRWLAYVSDESGRNEVHVQPYPGPGRRWLVSTAGGREPVWSADGQELFYRNGDRMMVVAVQTEPAFSVGTPRVLFEGSYLSQGLLASNYDVTPDGQRFVMIQASGQQQEAPTQINVVLNWFEELKQWVPTN